MSIRLLTLNLWCYFDWQNRFQNIVDLIKATRPDVIVTQETQLDPRFGQFNQVDLINKEIAYPFTAFVPTVLRRLQKKEILEKPIQQGQGIFSLYPISSLETLFLLQEFDDKEPRTVVNFDVVINNQTHLFTNIHFSNREDWAQKHLQETLKYMENKGEQRILAGDFNSYALSDYKYLYAQNYQTSHEVKPYISYIRQNWTLDYVLLPKKYQFKSIDCRKEYVSDHQALLVEIETV